MNIDQPHHEQKNHFLKAAPNRRRSFRIYDDVDIFYQKLDEQELPENEQALENSRALPDSVSAENATLNVNLSASGISFTCQEALQAGEIILVRVLLLSSMTMVMCYCKVVYCKPSNPYESNRYPYTIGAEFVNLRPEDKALLSRHIQRKRRWQWFFRALMLVGFLILIYIPEVIVELLIEQFDLLLELCYEALYLFDELINYWISYLLGFLFPQSPTTVQTIGFYLQSVLYVVFAMWAFFHWIPQLLKSTVFRLRRFFTRKKASFGYFWGQLPLINKIAYVFASVGIIALPGMFLI